MEQPPIVSTAPTPHATRVPLLDHGYIQIVNHWGSDQEIIEAARQSTDKGFQGWEPHDCSCVSTSFTDGVVAKEWSTDCTLCRGTGTLPGDMKLLRFLHEKKHSTPFEMCGLTFEVQAPLFVFREWHRHRIPFGYSELSARYSPMPDLNYVPTLERVMANTSGKNKQAGRAAGSVELTAEHAEYWRAELEQLYDHAQRVYESGLKRGVPKELARIVVPVGRYSRMRATGNLRGWMNFCDLRCAPDAQWEIRQYADQVFQAISLYFPRTFEVISTRL